MVILKDFLYLNADSLSQYVSQVEDGLRSQRSSVSGNSRSKEGGLGGSGVPLTAKGGTERSEEETLSISDTPQAQFERLVRAVKGNEESFGWYDILDPDRDFQGIPIGSFVSMDTEVYIPQMSKAFSSAGDLQGALSALQGMSKFMEATGTALPSNMPDASQIEILGNVAETMAGTESVVGEFDDSDWRITGTLEGRPARDDFDGFAHVVGKVAAFLSEGASRPLFSLPGQQLMSRQQRRAMEKKGPDVGQEENWISGPAVVLNILAIYR